MVKGLEDVVWGLLEAGFGVDEQSLPVVMKMYIDEGLLRLSMWGVGNGLRVMVMSSENVRVTKSTVNCNCVLASLSMEACVNDSHAIYSRMTKSGITIDVIAYTCFINALCRKGMIVESERMFSEMGEKGVAPTVVTCNAMIQGYYVSSWFDEAVAMYDKMESDDPITNIKHLCNGRDWALSGGRFEDVLRIFYARGKHGLTPNNLIYGTLLNCLCKVGRMQDAIQGDLDEAVKVFREISENGLKPDVIAYTTLIQRYCKVGKTKFARELLGEMDETGLKWDMMAYFTLMEGFCVIGDSEAAEKLLSDT